MLWRYYYRIIKACNEIFDTVGGDESVPANEDSGGSDRSQYAPLSTIMGGIKIQF